MSTVRQRSLHLKPRTASSKVDGAQNRQSKLNTGAKNTAKSLQYVRDKELKSVCFQPLRQLMCIVIDFAEVVASISITRLVTIQYRLGNLFCEHV